MIKAGLIDNPARGRFVASAAGRSLLATNPTGINVDTLKTYPAFAEFYVSSTSGARSTDAAPTGACESIDATTSATPEEQIDAAQAVLHQPLKADLLQRILAQSPAFFERAIIDLLVGIGYGGSHENAARRLGKTGDGGIDGVIDEDRLGLDRIYV
jgi:restriction system protein